MSHLDEPRYATTDVAAAARISVPVLNGQIARGELPATAPLDAEMPGHGRARRFSLRRVLHIALSRELQDRGMEPRSAAIAALLFTDTGDSRRAPGELFDGEPTIFRIECRPAGAWGFVETSAEVRRNLALDCLGHTTILIDLNDLCARVRAAVVS